MHHPLTPDRLAAVLRLLDVPDRSWVVAAEGLGSEYAPVTRLRFDRPVGPGGDRSVVVKTRRVDGPGWGGPHHLRREIAALGLGAVLDHPATARLLGVDEPAGVVVASDLGSWPSLEAVLLGGDPMAAREAIVALADAAASLHAATLGVEVEHRNALAALGTDARRDRLGLWPGVDRWDDVVAATRALRFPDAALAAADVHEVRRALEEPGPFGALTHLDLNPTNVVIAPDGAKLVDFEGSTFGHVGMDVAFLQFPFPNYSAHWAALPEAVVAAVDDAYRTALSRALPASAMEAYDRMVAVGAAWALAIRVLRLPVLAADGQSAHDSWRRRAQLVQQIEVFDRLATRADALPRLRAWFVELRDAMAERWPDATSPPPPLFPAFVG